MHRLVKIAISLLFFTVNGLAVYAQTADLSGYVYFGKNQPAEFVSVYIKGTNIGTSTNNQGYFELKDLNLGTYEVVASFIGFKTAYKKIELKLEGNKKIQFYLEEDGNLMQDVVITGTLKEMSRLNSPVPVEVYSAQFFENNKTASVFESLQNVNGVRPQLNCSVCNTGDIHINGLEGPYTMVLIDGMPIVSGLSTVYGLTGIPSSLIERIEIVKGPASTLYGSEAVGGLINVITKKPLNAPLFAADIYGTSWAEYHADLAAKYKLSKRVNALMGINYFNYQNPIDNNGDGFTDMTLQDRVSVFNKLQFIRKSKKEFNLGARYVYEDRWGGQMNWTPEFRGGDSIYGESIYTNRWELFGNYELPTEEKFNLQFSANSHEQNSVYGNTIYQAQQKIAFGQMTWNKAFASHDLMLGSAYRYTFYDDNTPATSIDEGLKTNAQEIHLPGFFIQDQITLNEFNTLLLGARYDYNSVHGKIFSPRINYKWNSENNKSVFRISAGNGFRVANVFTEDHAALTGARELVFKEELNPETSRNVNLNLVKRFYLPKGIALGLDATAFYTYFNNRIVPDYETNPNQIIYDNLNGSAVSKGISLNADLRHPNSLKMIAGVTLMDVSISENGETRRQLLTERFTGTWSVEYTFSSLGFTINYTGNLYSPMRLPLLGESDYRDEYSPWFSIQNIQVSKRINGNWEVYGGLKNILNFTPSDQSIARAFDPFDKEVQFNAAGEVIASPSNPNALSFDPTYVYASNQGIRGFLGVKYTLQSKR